MLDTCGRLSGGWAGGGDVSDDDRARLDRIEAMLEAVLSEAVERAETG